LDKKEKELKDPKLLAKHQAVEMVLKSQHQLVTTDVTVANSRHEDLKTQQ